MANGTLAASQIEMLTQSGTGIVTIVPPATNTNRTLTLPDSTGTLLNTNGGTITGNLTVSGITTLGNGAVLGVPASGTATNLTGLPISTGVSGLGTGIATALAVNVGTAGAPVVNGGALGSPNTVGTMPAFTLGGTVSGGGNQINNVIIGTTTPLAGNFTTLSGFSSATGVTVTTAFLQAQSGSLPSSSGIGFGVSNGTNLSSIHYVLENGGTGASSLRFYTHNGTSNDERLRINASGNTEVTGTLSATSGYNGTVGATTANTGAFTTLSASGLSTFSTSIRAVGMTDTALTGAANQAGFMLVSSGDYMGLRSNTNHDLIIEAWQKSEALKIANATGLVTMGYGAAVTGALSATETVTVGKTANSNFNALSLINSSTGAAAGIYTGYTAGTTVFYEYNFGSGYTTSAQYIQSSKLWESTGSFGISSGHGAGGGITRFYVNDTLRTQIDTTGLAVTGALSTTGNATVGNAVAATDVYLNIAGVASRAGGIAFKESGVDKWLIGNGAASNNGKFELYNTTGVVVLSVDKTSSVSTFGAGVAVTGTLSSTLAITTGTDVQVANGGYIYSPTGSATGLVKAGIQLNGNGNITSKISDVTVTNISSTGLAVTGALSATGITSTSDTTDATSTTAASLTTAGGLGVAKAGYFGGAVSQQVKGSTTIVNGAGRTNFFTPQAGQTFTFTVGGEGGLFLINYGSNGDTALIFFSYLSATMTIVAGAGAGQIVLTSSPGSGIIGVYKSANSSTISVIYGAGISTSVSISVIGTSVVSVTDPV